MVVNISTDGTLIILTNEPNNDPIGFPHAGIVGTRETFERFIYRLTHDVHILELNGESYHLNRSHKQRTTAKID